MFLKLGIWQTLNMTKSKKFKVMPMDIKKLVYPLLAVVIFMAGYHLHSYLHTCPLIEPHTCPEPQIVTQYKDKVHTEVVYVPKERDEKTDIDIEVGKPELYVKVNDKDFVIQKTDEEKYVFDKNKLSLTQTSRSDLRIDVPTIDNTKRWEIGLGASKDGVVGFVGFPVKEHLGGWVAGNEDYQMGGIMIRF